MTDFNKYRELLQKDRSVRRFEGNREVEEEALCKLVELTKYCASGRNLQPLKYRIVFSRNEREEIFPLMAWAGYLTDWPGPEDGERPTGYLIQCLDTRLTRNCLCDDGIQLQAITLGATAMGLGACIIKSFKVDEVKKKLDLPEWAEPLYIIALGYPKEEIRIETTDGSLDADIKYYRTQDGIHHVPKRPMKELLL